MCDLWPGLGNRKWQRNQLWAFLIKINRLCAAAKGLHIPFGPAFRRFVWLVCHDTGVTAKQALKAAIRPASYPARPQVLIVRCRAVLSACTLHVVLSVNTSVNSIDASHAGPFLKKGCFALCSPDLHSATKNLRCNFCWMWRSRPLVIAAHGPTLH